MQNKPVSLVEDFQRYFTVDLVTTEEMRQQCFSIRHRVYCEEFAYEDASAHPDGMEVDEYDDHAYHCLITHLASGMPAGCVRLVCVDDERVMPMEHFCGDAIDEHFIESLRVPRTSICEFSRLAVDGAFRRRSGERLSRYGELDSMDLSRREERTFSLIAVSTFTAAFATSTLIGRPNCFAMMEPFLPRMLQRSGVHVRSAGQETEYHGRRAPYYISAEAAYAGMQAELQELYDAIHERFSSQLTAARTDLTEPAGQLCMPSGMQSAARVRRSA